MDRVLTERRISVVRLRPAPSYTEPVTFHYEIQNHTTRMQKLTKAFKVYRLTIMTLVCVVAGLSIGLISRPYAKDWTERQFMYIEMPGELYLRMLKLMIVPLIVSNVILSFGSIQGKLSSHLGKVAGFLYLGSNFMAITIAIVLALLMNPGTQKDSTVHPNSNPHGNGVLNQENVIQLDRHSHFFSEYQDSTIRRYREYHPMSFHTDHSGFHLVNKPNQVQHTILKPNGIRLLQNKPATMEISSIKIEEAALVELPPVVGEYSETSSSSKTNDTSDSETESFLVNTSIENHINEEHRIGLNTKLPIDVLLDVLRNLIPDNLLAATMQQSKTRLFAPKELVINRNGTTNPPPSRWPMGHEMVDQANIIGLLAISVLTGVTLSHMDEARKPMLDLCACISELSIRIGMMALNLTPFCIMFLLIGQVARARDLSSVAGELFMYSMTVIVGLLFHGFIFLPLVYYIVTKKSPIEFLVKMFEPLVATFATSSSSATMALVLSSLIDLGFNPVIVRAFGPLGSVFNMNGTAIYEAIGAIFIAQTLQVNLPLTSLLLVGLSSAVASLSTTGIPSSGMMTMVIVLDAINLPVLQLSLIYIVDFIIDRFRTVINVWSGALVCGLIDHICPEHLFEEEMKPEKYQEMVRYRQSVGRLSKKSSLGEDESQKPQVISVTITPPETNSRV